MDDDELCLQELIREFNGQLSASVIDHCVDLLVNGEATIALEELCAYLSEYNVTLHPRQREAIKRLGTAFGADPKWWSDLQ